MCSSSGSGGGSGGRSGGSTTGRHLGQAVAVTKQTASTKRSGEEKLESRVGGKRLKEGSLFTESWGGSKLDIVPRENHGGPEKKRKTSIDKWE